MVNKKIISYTFEYELEKEAQRFNEWIDTNMNEEMRSKPFKKKDELNTEKAEQFEDTIQKYSRKDSKIDTTLKQSIKDYHIQIGNILSEYDLGLSAPGAIQIPCRNSRDGQKFPVYIQLLVANKENNLSYDEIYPTICQQLRRIVIKNNPDTDLSAISLTRENEYMRRYTAINEKLIFGNHFELSKQITKRIGINGNYIDIHPKMVMFITHQTETIEILQYTRKEILSADESENWRRDLLELRTQKEQYRQRGDTKKEALIDKLIRSKLSKPISPIEIQDENKKNNVKTKSKKKKKKKG